MSARPDPTLPGKPRSRLARRAAFAGLMGTFIETYDFAVYAYLVVFTAPLFFPAENETTAILASLVVFAAGFVARPLGGIFFGRMGDLRGRRTTLVITVVGMGLATAALGIIPSYQQIGIAAPVLLVLARLVQGFSAGGEIMGAATYVAESGSPARRGLLSAATPIGAAAGIAFAPAVVGLTTALTSHAAMGAWGWRLPFLLSLPLTIACLLYRIRLEDTPGFTELAAREEVAKAPVKEVLARHWKNLLRVAALAIAINLAGYTLNSYIPLYLQTQVKLPAGTVYWLAAIVLALALPANLLGGLAVDRFGQRKVMAVALACCLVAVYPAILVMSGAGSSILAVGAVYWLLVSCVQAASPPAYAAFVGLFPTRVRYSGAAIGYNIGNIAGGGFAPYLAALLTASTGSLHSPALLIGAAALVGIVTILTSPVSVAGRRSPAVAEAGPSRELRTDAGRNR
ncbi:MAG TPA: MFS transporter [Amycolatopsis sp.]|nr:MFS transporter [Amycolatopsis sp.]